MDEEEAGRLAEQILASPMAATARERIREIMTTNIMEAAQLRLRADGAAGLSIRAVAADIGMAPSAIYYYYPTKDALMTALIVDAYEDLAESMEQMIDMFEPGRAQWLAGCRTMRVWALQHPHEFALIYGTPVPGYQAPTDTIEPSSRVQIALLETLENAVEAGVLTEPAGVAPPAELAAELTQIGDAFDVPSLSPTTIMRAVTGWIQLTGLISLEQFGHLDGGFSDNTQFFEHAIALLADGLGFAPTTELGLRGVR